MHCQGERGGWSGHRALAFSIPAMAILRGTSTNKTAKSGSLAKVMRPKASPAKSSEAGRPPVRHNQPYAGRDQQAGGCRGDAAEDVPDDQQVNIFEEQQADRKADCPWDDEKAGNCGDRSDRAPHLCSDTHSNSDDVRPGHE